MKTVKVYDITLREIGRARSAALSFKERVEIARTLDRLQVDAVELPVLKDGRAGALSNKTIASVVDGPRLSAAVGLTPESVDQTWDSIQSASRPALHVMLPASAVQMEYLCHKKAPAMVELTRELVARARQHTERVEFSALDATRAEPAVLRQLLAAALEAGADTVTLCDTAGIMTPDECARFLRETVESVPGLEKVRLGVELSNSMHMAAACAAAALEAGAEVVKTAITDLDVPTTANLAAYLAARGEEKGLGWGLRTTELSRAAGQLDWLLRTQRSSGSPFDSGVSDGAGPVCLTAGDGAGEVARAVDRLGYDLTEEDHARVYEAFQRIAASKRFVSARELDAIIATTALQVPAAYRIVSYVITCGSAVSAMAHLALEHSGQPQQGMAAGDGPIDAAFLAIEQIIGHHYELADFQIQTVTEGREAMGSALVKLRSNGKLYSGSGISTDIIGACIRAYISALNKIVYEEA